MIFCSPTWRKEATWWTLFMQLLNPVQGGPSGRASSRSEVNAAQGLGCRRTVLLQSSKGCENSRFWLADPRSDGFRSFGYRGGHDILGDLGTKGEIDRHSLVRSHPFGFEPVTVPKRSATREFMSGGPDHELKQAAQGKIPASGSPLMQSGEGVGSPCRASGRGHSGL